MHGDKPYMLYMKLPTSNNNEKNFSELDLQDMYVISFEQAEPTGDV